jgi:hypothetical protein
VVNVVISSAGTQGPPGLGWLPPGIGAPSDSLGVDGSMYLDQTNPDAPEYWGPKTAGTWTGHGPYSFGSGGSGPSPATTVTAASSYGQSTVVGTDTTYAREDHSHGTPALTTTAPATTEGVGQAAALGSATLPARADHVHPLAAAGAPAASAVTSTQVTGVASTFAASDHVHAREGFGAVTAQTSFGASSGNGSAATVAHSDHTHGTPTLPTATISVAGVVQLDGTAADIQALGAQAAGASGLAADALHVHPTTGVVTGVTAADTSVVVGGTSGAPTVRTSTLDVIATQHPPAAAWSNNSHNITHVANGASASDAAAFGQIPTIGLSTDIQPLGALAAGATGRFADAAHVHPSPDWTPPDQGLLAWNYDPSLAGTTWVPTSTTNGYLFLTAMILRQSQTLTNILYGLSGAQTSGLTSGQNLIGLYNSSGTLLTQTADQTTIWSTTADQKVNVVPWQTVQTSLAAGKYYVAFLYNGVTTGAALNFKASGAGTTANAGQTGASLRYGVITGTATSLPSNITLSSMATPSPFNSQWLGFS